jgi:glycosyltransferase involved in cell wall biosynthesis
LLSLPNTSYEIICIDDGSKDKTLNKLRDVAATDNKVKVAAFSRNFGKEKAMYAGLELCNGKAAIIIDADLQDPVELISEFIKKWKQGYETVYGLRINRDTDSFFKKLTANIFYKVFNRMSQVPIFQNGGDFRLIDRKIINAIKDIRDNKLFMKYIFNWPGYKSYPLGFVRKKRVAGKSKWNYWKLLNFALDGISASTTIPLRIWTYLGLLISSISFISALYILSNTLFGSQNFAGYTIIGVSLMFLGGIQLIAFGIMGEYLGRTLEEVRRRPMYIIADKINLS